MGPNILPTLFSTPVAPLHRRPERVPSGGGEVGVRSRRPSFSWIGLMMLLSAFFAGADTTEKDGGRADGPASGVEGVWINAAGDGYIEIRRHGDTLYGTILGGPDDDDRLDSKNPDPSLRSRRLTGARILEGFEPDGSGRWIGGSIYDPNNGKTYRCTLEVEDENTLKVRGFVGISLFGRTERWVRKKDD